MTKLITTETKTEMSNAFYMGRYWDALMFNKYIENNPDRFFIFGVDFTMEKDLMHFSYNDYQPNMNVSLINRFLMILSAHLRILAKVHKQKKHSNFPYDFNFFWMRVSPKEYHNERFRVFFTLNRERCTKTLREIGLNTHPYGSVYLLVCNSWFRALRHFKIKQGQLPCVSFLNDENRKSQVSEYMYSFIKQMKEYEYLDDVEDDLYGGKIISLDRIDEIND
jgi:hypothetical protein